MWEEKLRSLNTEDNSIWKMVKSLKGSKTRSAALTVSGRLPASSDQDKADVFADSLEQQCTPNPPDPAHEAFAEAVPAEVASRLSARSTETRSTSVDEIQGYIKGLKSRKAPGPDGITNAALKALPPVAVQRITCIINAALRLCHFPSQWRDAVVVMIHKAGKPRSEPANYRPISLLCTLGKLLEKAILTRLTEEVEMRSIIPPEQHGFRIGHSTCHQLVRVVEFIINAFNWKQYAGALFLDIAKAFDKVWHAGLLWKLLEQEIPDSLVAIAESFLDNRTFRVRVGVSLSSRRPVRSGVPQGSILGPTLYDQYVADMPRGIAGTTTAQYADDTGVLFRSRRPELVTRHLQEAMDATDDWFKRWRITVNPEKSSAVLFHRRRVNCDPHGQVTVSGRAVPWVDSVKYLGVHLDQGLRFKEHLATARKKAHRVLAATFPLFSRDSALDSRNKVLLYKTLIRPVLTYAAPVWGQAASSHKALLQVTQNKVLRMAVNAPWYISNAQIHQDLNVEDLDTFCSEVSTSFFMKATVHSNPTISGALQYEPHDVFKHRRPMSAVL